MKWKWSIKGKTGVLKGLDAVGESLKLGERGLRDNFVGTELTVRVFYRAWERVSA